MKDNRKGKCPKCGVKTSKKRVKKYGQCEICYNENRSMIFPERFNCPIFNEIN